MKKFRTVASIVIMFFAAVAGYFICGAGLQEDMGGAILFAVIAGFACVICNMDNRE